MCLQSIFGLVNNDVSVSHQQTTIIHVSEFTSNSWMMLVIVEMSLLLILSAAMYTIQRCQETKATHNQTSFFIALNMVFRSIINKSIEFKLKSGTYRILLLNVMT